MLWMKDRVDRHRPKSTGDEDDVETAFARSHGGCTRSSSMDSWGSASGDLSEASSPSELSLAHGGQVSEAAFHSYLRDGSQRLTEGGIVDAGPILISLDKRRGPIGVVVSNSSSVPKVSKITGGLVEEWNNRHPHRKMSAGDTILEVNGVRGDPIAMLVELARGPDSVRLLVLPQLQPASQCGTV
jgi:hypothetical protein